jgi:hypothetical protein
MKSIVSFLFENTDTIKTTEVVDILKKSGETQSEIKKEVNTNKKVMTYPEFLRIYCGHLLNYCDKFIKNFNIIIKKEKSGLEKTVGIDNVNKIYEIIKTIERTSIELYAIIKKEYIVNENSIEVHDINNYVFIKKMFTTILEFENKAKSFENNNYKTLQHEYPKLVEIRDKISKNVQRLDNAKSVFSKLIDIIYRYKTLK